MPLSASAQYIWICNVNESPRVLSIFEGADETLCIKVIARKLVADAKA